MIQTLKNLWWESGKEKRWKVYERWKKRRWKAVPRMASCTLGILFTCESSIRIFPWSNRQKSFSGVRERYMRKPRAWHALRSTIRSCAWSSLVCHVTRWRREICVLSILNMSYMWNNRPFYSCVLCYLAMNVSEAEGDLALIQTSLLFSCKWQLVSIKSTWFAQ